MRNETLYDSEASNDTYNCLTAGEHLDRKFEKKKRNCLNDFLPVGDLVFIFKLTQYILI